MEIIGGLGNQLFQFFAGKFIADKNKCELVLNIDRIGFLASNHGFQLPTVIKKDNYVIKHNTNPNFAAKSSRFSEILQRRLLSDKITKLIWEQYNSKVVGYDYSIENLTGVLNFRGYFQSYKYFQSSPAYRDMLSLLNPSTWYDSVYSDISSSNSVVIHVRRGDYVGLSDSFGILDGSYYKRAVSIANEIVDFPRYFIFSDDIKIARQILDFLPAATTSFIQPPSTSNPSETLFLMSQGKVLITANSTFSLWSGLIANPDSVVITPEKWFKSLEDPLNLRPPNWIHCFSSWE